MKIQNDNKQPMHQEIKLISSLILIEIIILMTGFFFLFFGIGINLSNFLSVFILPFKNILSILTLIVSLSLFPILYGLRRGFGWSRSISIKIFFINILIDLAYFTLYTFLGNEIKNLVVSIFLGAIGINIISIYLLHKSNVKTQFKETEKYDNIVNNHSVSFLSTSKITLLVIGFLIAKISFTIIDEYQNFANGINSEPEMASLTYVVIKNSTIAVEIGIMVFTLWWFSRTYNNLKALGITELNFSTARVILSFIIPIKNLYEPVKLLKTIWKASEPNKDIIDSKWKNVKVPKGLNIWWLLVIASVIGEIEIFTSISAITWMFDTFVKNIFAPLACISTIIIVRKINSRIDMKRKMLN